MIWQEASRRSRLTTLVQGLGARFCVCCALTTSGVALFSHLIGLLATDFTSTFLTLLLTSCRNFHRIASDSEYKGTKIIEQ
jgi:hypothetical protein